MKRIRKASTATDVADVIPLCLLSTECLTAASSCSLLANCPRHANLEAYLQAPQAAELIDADGPDSAAPPTELLQVLPSRHLLHGHAVLYMKFHVHANAGSN